MSEDGEFVETWSTPSPTGIEGISYVPSVHSCSEQSSFTSTAQSSITNQFNFTDIEQTIGCLNENTNISRWFEDFDDYSKLCNWSEPHKCFIASKLLVGLPRLFIDSLNYRINDWNEMKTVLMHEFDIKLNGLQLHRLLSERRLNNGEGFYEYFLVMKELAARGSIDNESLIQYIVDGIPDSVQMKYTLCEVSSLEQLKEKLKIMTKFQQRMMNKKFAHDKHSRNNEHFSGRQENIRNDTSTDINSTDDIESGPCGDLGHCWNNNQKKLQNNTGGQQLVNTNGLSSEHIEQIMYLMMPYFNDTLREIRAKIEQNSEKLTNIKIETERLSEASSRQIVNMGALTKRVQALEDRDRNLSILLKDNMLMQVKDGENKNLLKHDENSEKNYEKLLKQEEKSVKQEEKSVKQEEKSVKQEEKSVKQEEKSVKQEEKSVKQEEKSVKQEEKQDNQTVVSANSLDDFLGPQEFRQLENLMQNLMKSAFGSLMPNVGK